MYRDIDAIGATNYVGWYQDTYDPPAVVNAGIAAFLRELHHVFGGRVLVVSEFGAEANELNAPGQPGSLGFQAQLLTRHIRAYQATAVARRRARLEPAGLRAHAVVRGRLDPARGARHQARGRDQPEGPVHLRRPAQAGRRSGPPRVRRGG